MTIILHLMLERPRRAHHVVQFRQKLFRISRMEKSSSFSTNGKMRTETRRSGGSTSTFKELLRSFRRLLCRKPSVFSLGRIVGIRFSDRFTCAPESKPQASGL